jgi:ABC-type spermidine/putrescine transport system permease subunit II
VPGALARVRALVRRGDRDDVHGRAQNTLPIWILGNLRLGQQLPQVNVMVFFVIVMTVIPVAIAARLTRDTGILRRR